MLKFNKEISKFIAKHQSCAWSKGDFRSCIYDFQRDSLILIPNFIYDLFDNCKIISIDYELSVLTKEESSNLISWIEFLSEKEVLLFSESTSDLEPFKDIEIIWEDPAHITNIIIDDYKIETFELTNLFSECYSLNCTSLQFRFFEAINFDFLQVISEELKLSDIGSVEIICKFEMKPVIADIKVLLENRKINRIIFHSQSEDLVVENSKPNQGVILLTKQSIDSHFYCGSISRDYFSLNIETYMESVFHNSCLNRKISIDAEGNIKNCPSMKESYGNIKDTTLAEAIEKPGFKKYWDINKDKIHVCRDCEFRYICTDCRAYVEDPEDILSKPLKCGYNPYTGEWSEWSTNPLKQKAIDFYGMREMVEEMGGRDNDAEAT